MENPHESEQNVLLERIIRNVDKCDEAFQELNTCIREIIESSLVVRAAAELSVNYEANTAHYLQNVKAMREPKASNS
ncbi:hypothetical protein CC85DRAFT_285687 [Cutaneotrichosporon oleaginosum]|uniref:DASH complex subunit DAD4 n=1 Tax=Cutaneotrichosporon oleaginosum TaxID=879819 RepID=A0A0J0XMH3_9TREE|nr:uncharacterized protein CC85DRAFT_285687 [Cutaneotrichosporon oleaginosum]KLT42282.1 hypothetical protein CC85DRAFT_285687 [Cutaneotrichosporon oleaginosum]TXT11454.1 hypothetical protein COLE_01864 [Cutaneotrichosporon oleaginosum]